MNKKNQSKMAFNILNIIRLEKDFKKQKNNQFPISKLKPSISSYTLFLNQKKKYKNSLLNKEPKNINYKNKIYYNKQKYLNSTKSIELIQTNKQFKDKKIYLKLKIIIKLIILNPIIITIIILI